MKKMRSVGEIEGLEKFRQVNTSDFLLELFQKKEIARLKSASKVSFENAGRFRKKSGKKYLEELKRRI